MSYKIPDELFEYIMCNEVWHCTPSEFREQSSYDTELHWLIHNKKKEAINEKNKPKSN